MFAMKQRAHPIVVGKFDASSFSGSCPGGRTTRRRPIARELAGTDLLRSHP